LINFFEKEARVIGRIDRNQFYRKHVIVAFTMLATQCDGLKRTNAMVSIVQGLIENICPTTKHGNGARRSDIYEDLTVEYQEENANFERTTFQPLNSIEITKEETLPNIENYTVHVLQCVEAVIRDENSEFLSNVGSGLTKDTQEYFGQL